MYFDVNWVRDRKVAKLQRVKPTEWPVYWCAYLAALADAWAHRSRLRSFTDAVPLLLAVDPDEAENVLKAVGLLDRGGHIPKDSWDEWYGPVEARLRQATHAAAVRWQSGSNAGASTAANKPKTQRKNAGALLEQSGSNAGAMPIDREIDISLNNGSNTSRRARTRTSHGPTAMSEAMRAAGFDPSKLP